jgi:diguanylate cyclase (GGDEF)-like protein
MDAKGEQGGGSGFASLTRLVASGARTYAGADEANGGRVIAVICMLSALLVAAFLPLDPPDEAIGEAGWAIAFALIVAGLVAARALAVHPTPVSHDLLLATSYAGLAAIGVLEWLAGGTATAYTQLTLLWLASAMGGHPWSRAMPFLVATALVTAAPLAYDGSSQTLAEELAASFLFTATLGLLVFCLMSYIRAQRVELTEQRQHAQELARGDSLTGLGNRRAFDEALDAELGRSRRASSITSIGLIDVDRLKEVNDRFGHLDGDRCLRETAAAIRRSLRAGDQAFRWAGDEFAVLLPDTDLEGAEQAAARIAADVLTHCAAADGTPLSVSWGVAQVSDEMDATELLGRADLELMAMKRERLEAG